MVKSLIITFVLIFSNQLLASDLAVDSGAHQVQRSVAFSNPFKKRCRARAAQAAVRKFIRQAREVKKGSKIQLSYNSKETRAYKKISPRAKDLRVYSVVYLNKDGQKCTGLIETVKSMFGGCKAIDGIFTCSNRN